MNGKTIILISSEAWGDVFVSKHHYASFLSETNKVYYLNPPSIPWTITSPFKVPVRVRAVKKGLHVIDYGNPWPLLGKLPKPVQDHIHSRIINAVMKRIAHDTVDLIWSFDLKRFFNLQNWPSGKRIFHAVELINHPFFIQDAPHRQEVLKSADLVLSIADIISEQARPWNHKVHQINHGIDIRKYESMDKSERLPGKGRIKAGFVGNFQVSFDFDLLKKLATGHPEVDFIMIGPRNISNLGALKPEVVERINAIEKQENIYFLGKVRSEELPSYQRSFDINLIIYGDDFAEGHCNPHKLMSYFYFGKVIVSSFIDQYKNQPDLVQMVRYNRDLPDLFSQVVNQLEEFNSEELQKKRREFALNHDYRVLIKTIEGLISHDE